jgi:hypothetical protein
MPHLSFMTHIKTIKNERQYVKYQDVTPIYYYLKAIIAFLSFSLLNLNVYSQSDLKKTPLVHQADSLFIFEK